MRFPDWDLRVISEPQVTIVIPAVHPDVGDVEIHGDEDNLILEVGKFTHGHFSNYDNTLSKTQAVEKTAEDVVSFLSDLFADQIVFWGSRQAGRGGWYKRGLLPTTPFSTDRGQEDVWSGPYESEKGKK